MFEKSLSALIKGLRSHRGKDEAKYVASMLEEIRAEIKSADMDIKAEAVLKLAYLQMLGYRVSSASFHILETMASSKYHIKHIGYLAATLCWAEDTEVLILATNLIKKDLHSAAHLDVLAALHGLSHVITQELAQHLVDDISVMLTHSRALVRKRAVLVLYSAITKCPDILDRTWERLRDLLCDEHQSVATATVNVICELARRNPAPFVTLSPQLFQILTTTSNNWLLIKVVKLFGALAPVEPRLVRKLQKPLTEIISTTPAMSLLYECIHTTIIGGMLQGPGSEELAWRCVDNLGHFLNDEDQNLRYIALLALGKLIPTHPHLVAQHQETILNSISHPDLTIRLRALDLACHLAESPSSLQSVVEALMNFLEKQPTAAVSDSATQSLSTILETENATSVDPSSLPPSSTAAMTNFRIQVIESILDLGSAEQYAHISDPSWYLDTLVRLVDLAHAAIVPRIVTQLTEFVFLHPSIQSQACEMLLPMLLDAEMYSRDNPTSEVIRAGAAICSEFVNEVEDVPALVRALVQDQVKELSPQTMAVSIHSALKLYAYWAASLASTWTEETKTSLLALTEHMSAQLTSFARLEDTEVHERVQEGLQLFVLIQKGLEAVKDQPAAPKHADEDWGEKPSEDAAGPRALHLLLPLYYVRSEEATPPAPLPASMNLRAWIAPESSWKKVWDAIEPTPVRSKPKVRREHMKSPEPVPEKQDTESRTKPSPQRREYMDNPFYLDSSSSSRTKKSTRKKNSAPVTSPQDQDDLTDVPIVKLDLSDLTPKPASDTPTANSQVQPKMVARKKTSRRK
ncbi:adaptor protein complex ap-3 delta subunit [Malassezia pachydermatis]|uniref:Adaptor protein complex ap-3 delta subunit n=1 Tax=Malassezia pachydermatis TaxID=77020 RepID=A0A0M8MW35_9BASI|nr:adaptor protein complex ap-3 delta subunit [Malassezia pachydermatis]KOS14711.1 adaptor protein complex ap-3 delta subunit [Malassezia pachydermatis]